MHYADTVRIKDGKRRKNSYILLAWDCEADRPLNADAYKLRMSKRCWPKLSLRDAEAEKKQDKKKKKKKKKKKQTKTKKVKAKVERGSKDAPALQ